MLFDWTVPSPSFPTNPLVSEWPVVVCLLRIRSNPNAPEWPHGGSGGGNVCKCLYVNAHFYRSLVFASPPDVCVCVCATEEFSFPSSSTLILENEEGGMENELCKNELCPVMRTMDREVQLWEVWSSSRKGW